MQAWGGAWQKSDKKWQKLSKNKAERGNLLPKKPTYKLVMGLGQPFMGSNLENFP